MVSKSSVNHCWISSGGCRPRSTRFELGLNCCYLVVFVGLLAGKVIGDGEATGGDKDPRVPLDSEEKGLYIGCFKERIDLYDALMYVGNADACVDICERAYYRYAVLSENKCACSTDYDFGMQLEQAICQTRCKQNRAQFCGGIDAQSYYATGVKVSGPPTNLKILELGETTMSLFWNDPPQVAYVKSFVIKANVVKTFSLEPLSRLSEWVVEEHERHLELINLHSGTLYNISVTAMGETSEGGTSFIEAETLIAKPDPLPNLPKVLERGETTLKVAIPESINNNGPVSFYRLVVMTIDESLQQEFDESFLGSYNSSSEEGYPYYITAQIPHQDIFIVGDGQIYGDFYNAPLEPGSHVHISIGIVSIHKGITKVAYSIANHEQHSHKLSDSLSTLDDDDEGSIVALSVACVIFGLLLIISFIVYGYLRFKTGNHPHRLSDNHELTLQGPMVEVENNGYVPENHMKENFRDQLNDIIDNLDSSQKFARNSIRLNIDNILAVGNFGDVISGKLYSNTDTHECQVNVVSDDMEAQDQLAFIKDFKQLIRITPHENLIRFFGVSASSDWFYLIFELPPVLLKKRLVEARIPPSVNNSRFSAISEETILQWVYEIAVAMEYLETNKAVHKRLCSYSIYLTDTQQIKISLFGPPRLTDHEKEIDISRWLAPEVLRFQHHSGKGDVWSFGCVAWECCTLGGTLYANITSLDLIPRIKNGLRPEQPAFIFHDLYQLFLNCWQMEPSERPDFEEVAFNVRQALTSPRHCLSYDRIDNVIIPYYLPLLEIKN